MPHRRVHIALLAATLGCIGLLQSCLRGPHVDSASERTAERAAQQAAQQAALRARLHDAMARHSLVSNRQSWDIISAGARLSSDTIRLFYQRDPITGTHRASGTDQNQADYWNREHVWPQSYGLRGTAAARDLHNIVPADRTINTSRGNKLFAEAASAHKECTECRSSRESWEPPDSAKGDVARILFYMDVRYDGSSDTPDLQLSDTPDKDSAVFGFLTPLQQWHCRDPVSGEERQRNDVVARAQGNRNLFIDSPELAERVFGFSCIGAN